MKRCMKDDQMRCTFILSEAGKRSPVAYDRCGKLQIYAGVHRTKHVYTIRYEGSITLITCEDEMETGDYASRRIIAARPLNF